MREPERILGIDLGGTKLRVALTDLEGHMIARRDVPTEPAKGPEQVLNKIVAMVGDLTRNGEMERVLGVGLAAPGPLDLNTGVLIVAANMPGWHNVPHQKELSGRLQKPVYIDNDANAAAVGEWQFGAGKGLRNVLYMTVSTGIGGGVISEGHILHGARGLAGEVGHMTIDIHGPKCACGNTGCLEVLASGTAIARQAVELIKTGLPTALTDMVGDDLTKITAQLVTKAAREGDGLALELMQRVGEYIGIGLVNLFHLFNPEMAIIGGGVSQAGDLIFVPAREIVHHRTMEGFHEGIPIIPATLGDDVGLLGAAALVLSHL
jgi:glucokinase